MNQRASGVLLPLFSLPGDYGCGSLGKDAFSFVDFLAQAGQRYWQILPLVPSGGGNSPYMSPSAFAGNPFFIDLDSLVEAGLLSQAELTPACAPNPDRVDYARLYETRIPILRTAWQRGREGLAAILSDFLARQSAWLEEHALFLSIKAHFDGLPYWEWPDLALRQHDQEAHSRCRDQMKDEFDFQVFLQYLFFSQWEALRTYAHTKGVSIIGDLPIYVSRDSVELWAHPELFQLDEAGAPSAVAGVPPDAFSDVGQLWGNPLYDWRGNNTAVFAWWQARMEHTAKLCDVVRIDHFRGFHSYWSVPADAQTAKEGHWEPGPGLDLVRAITKTPGLEVIAEDLGDLDENALYFIRQSGLPGMKVLIYAFDPEGESAYLPHNCQPNSVVYTGTHDAPTFLQWLFEEASAQERQYATDYLRLRPDEGFGWGAVCGAWSAPSQLAVAPLQDILGLGGDARTNLPGTLSEENWSWRVRREALNSAVAQRLLAVTRTYRRD